MTPNDLTRAPRSRAVMLLWTCLFPVAGCVDAVHDVDDAPTALRAESAASRFPPGACDAVYEVRAHGPEGLDTPFMVGAGETHPGIAVDAPWGTREVQVVAWEPLIDNKKVLHHWILYDRGANLMGWSPGKESIPYPPDVGIDMPTRAGSLRLDMHYMNLAGQPQPDRSGVALCVLEGARRRPKSSAKHGGFSSASRVMVPANAQGHEVEGECKVQSAEPVTLLSVSPHAHLMARHARLAIQKPDGQEVVLHDDSFAFVEQTIYPLETPYVLAPGDVVTWMCRYDNTTNKNVGFGESTNDEMCILWTEYYPKGALRCGR